MARRSAGILCSDLEDAGDVDFGGVHQDFDAGFAHARAAHAEEVHVGALLQRAGQLRGVHVAGGFAGGDEDFGGRHGFSGVYATSQKVARRRADPRPGGQASPAFPQTRSARAQAQPHPAGPGSG